MTNIQPSADLADAAAHLVSYFPQVYDTKSPQHLPVSVVLDRMRSDEFKAQIEKIRSQDTKRERDHLKKQLPVVCFSGTFTERCEAGLQIYNGFICLDFDNIPEDQFTDIREKLKANKHTYALFTSPSGNGIKLLMRIAPEGNLHRKAYQAALEYFDSPFSDRSTSDPARGCFLSWDPELYLNTNALVFQLPEMADTPSHIPAQEVITGGSDPASLFSTTGHASLEQLLDQVEVVDLRELIGLTTDTERLSNQRLQVGIIEYVLNLAERNERDLCKTEGGLFLFNGSYWEAIEPDSIKRFLGAAAERMGVPHHDAHHFTFQEKLLKQFQASSHRDRPAAQNDQVLVNLRNGTFVVNTQEPYLKEHDPADFLTHMLPFDFDPEAKAETFQRFLDRVLPDQERQSVLAEFLGYLFIRNGRLKLEKALFLYGTGANGKSVFFEVVNALLGGDTNVCCFSLQNLMSENGYHRAQLANKLVNYASELNGRLEHSTFKQLVSGEPIEARSPYGKPFTVRTYAKFIFNSNSLPSQVELTNAFFRRFLIIPFDVTIPEEEQDKALADRIIREELPGVFNWVLHGLQRLLEQRNFTHCEAAKQMLDGYKRESDSALSFIQDEGLEVSGQNTIPLKKLFSQYKEYCLNNSLIACSTHAFSKRLKVHGFHLQRRNIGQVVSAEYRASAVQEEPTGSEAYISEGILHCDDGDESDAQNNTILEPWTPSTILLSDAS